MTQRSSASALVMLAVLMAAPLIVACQKGGQSIPVLPAQISPTMSDRTSDFGPANSRGRPLAIPGAPQTGSQGTADVGGGNGAKGQVLESFTVPYSGLRGYNVVLKPMFENFSKEIATDLAAEKKNKKDPNARPMSIYEMLPVFKTWYYAPIRLKLIQKEVLGFSFSEDNLQQLGIQTADEIVIDSELNSESPDEKFSALGVHETVMSWYLVQYVSIPDLCRQWQSKTGQMTCDLDGWAQIAARVGTFKPAKARPLAEPDYVRIRRVTDWVIRNGRHATMAELRSVLAANNFDPRLFRDHQKTTEVQLKDIEGDGILKLLKLAPQLGQDPRECWIPGSIEDTQDLRRIGPCSVGVKVLESRRGQKFFHDQEGTLSHLLHLTLELSGHKFDLQGWLSEKPGLTKSNEIVSVCLGSDVRTVAEGSLLRTGCLFLKPTAVFNDNRDRPLEARFELVGIEFRSGVVSRVSIQNLDFNLVTDYASGKQLRCVHLVRSRRPEPQYSSILAGHNEKGVDEILPAEMVNQVFHHKVCSPLE